MESILDMIRRVTIFVLTASLLIHLFSGTEYKKYYQYVTGLIVIALVLSPVLTVFGGDISLSEYLGKAVFTQDSEEMRAKMELVGEKQNEQILASYQEQVEETLARQYKVDKEDCKVTFDKENKIKEIQIQMEKMPENTTSVIQSIAMQYGVDEDSVYLYEQEEG